jgi:hypothetical protein
MKYDFPFPKYDIEVILHEIEIVFVIFWKKKIQLHKKINKIKT